MRSTVHTYMAPMPSSTPTPATVRCGGSSTRACRYLNPPLAPTCRGPTRDDAHSSQIAPPPWTVHTRHLRHIPATPPTRGKVSRPLQRPHGRARAVIPRVNLAQLADSVSVGHKRTCPLSEITLIRHRGAKDSSLACTDVLRQLP